jgi:isoleucyl-tRNA synthetase
MPFPALPPDESLEPEVGRRWTAHDVRQRALRHREPTGPGGAASRGSFVFYEGPPTANGRPAIHHVFSRTLKDVVCRHRLMAGFRVPRKAGWDTQGLPVEIEVQKRLGIATRDQIEALVKRPDGTPDVRASIAEFNRLCRESVFTYKHDWEALSLRMAYWLDYEHPYVTCEPAYIESAWALLARFHRAGLLKKDFKILPYCPNCQTGLSNHEVAQGYEDVQDPSVFVRFRVDGAQWRAHLDAWPELGADERARRAAAAPDGFSLLVWTTTPWTLFSNVAVAAGEGLEYALVEHRGELLMVARSRVEALFGKEARDLQVPVHGMKLHGLSYHRPLGQAAMPEGRSSLTVRRADFVSADDGTGFVHIAPAFGADDFSLRQRDGLPLLKPVDDAGRFTDEIGGDDFGRSLAGRFVKDADKDIIRELKARGLLWKQVTIDHPYPHCWRCRSPLLYMARPSWYLLTTNLRDRMLVLNARIDWHPPEIGAGRFGEWLAGNIDWAISRERYWGTPLNVWTCDACGREHAPESLDELGRLSGRALPAGFDPHRPTIDDVTLPCARVPGPPAAPPCAGTLRRTPEVVDCWFDSGAMPFAQAGWPRSSGGALPADFPADYISEGLDQTRGWFYTLHAIATLVTGLPEHAAEVRARGGDDAGLPAYRSVLVNNLLLDGQGRKMSKSRGNVVDPAGLFETVGVDAVRWFFLASGQVWTPKRFDGKALAESARRVFGTLRNCYAFLALYANLDGWSPGDAAPPLAARASIDRWLVSRLQTLTAAVGAAYDALDLTEVTRLLDAFIDAELSNWYVRRNRARFWKGGDDADKRAAFATLAAALERVALLLAPVAPYLADWLWAATSGAPGDASVHLADWPAADRALVDAELERQMSVVLGAVELGRSVRAAHDLRVRQPLAQARIKAADPDDAARLRRPDLARLVCEELNVRALEVVDRADFRVLTAKPDWKRLGPRLGPKLKAAGAAIAALDETALQAFEASGTLAVQLDGQRVEFDRQDVVLAEKGREGYAVAGDGRLVLALDTRLDDELLGEGRAREIVSRVQATRKSSGLEVADRIVLHLAGHADLLAAARRHEALILAEVLGTALVVHAEPRALPAGAQSFDVDGASLAVAVEKVAAR